MSQVSLQVFVQPLPQLAEQLPHPESPPDDVCPPCGRQVAVQLLAAHAAVQPSPEHSLPQPKQVPVQPPP